MTVTCNVEGCGRSWARDPVLEVACPQCQAPVGRKCRRPSEHPCETHAARDIAADRAGHYGLCPLGRCGLANMERARASALIEKHLRQGPRQRPGKSRNESAARCDLFDEAARDQLDLF